MALPSVSGARAFLRWAGSLTFCCLHRTATSEQGLSCTFGSPRKALPTYRKPPLPPERSICDCSLAWGQAPPFYVLPGYVLLAIRLRRMATVAAPSLRRAGNLYSRGRLCSLARNPTCRAVAAAASQRRRTALRKGATPAAWAGGAVVLASVYSCPKPESQLLLPSLPPAPPSRHRRNQVHR